VWITEGHEANYGLATIRTSQDGAKQAGITAMVIDMASPNVDIRPLREITGEALFNEVFLNDVFVPDDDVVGDVGNGWAVAQATFGNERVMLSSAESISSAFSLLALADKHGVDDPADRRTIAGLIAECQALLALGVRHAALAVEGRLPRSGGAVLKVATSELEQRVTSTALDLVGLAGIAGSSPDAIRDFLYAKCLTIGGGTSEILRNIIAERGLRMPREL
jgi:alkylation response protein AidB-like acyl-CoA dehydrogenase